MATSVEPFTAFSSLIDGRILRSMAAQGFTHPTPIQAATLPLAVAENKDILGRAKTGSGKTLAYGIPLVQRILNARSKLASTGSTSADEHSLCNMRALVLVPTRELAEQVTGHLRTLCQFLNDQDEVKIVNVAAAAGSSGKGKASADKLQRMQLAERPDVVVATPSRALTHLRSKALDLSQLECLVIDEADLILSYGHSSDDISAILTGGGGAWSLPAVYQSILMSATLTEEVQELKSVVLRNPVTIKLTDAASSSAHNQGNLIQYTVRTSEDDKFLLIYVILKLKLIKGKILIFVNDTDRSYRLKLFLEKFGIRSGVLNAELPFNSRYHAVQEFNRGVFQYLIATDESGLEGLEQDSDDEQEEPKPAETSLMSTQPDAGDGTEDASGAADGALDETSKKRKAADAKKTRKGKKARGKGAANEYGVTRGIDFVEVACVINFDLPTSAKSYTHRVGRTARAGRSGISLSFVVPRKLWGPENQPGKGKFETSLKSAKKDEKVWKRIEKDQQVNNGIIPGEGLKEYKFDMTQVEGFRYRMEDALRAVTRAYVREARIKELKNEVLNSDKLKAHFEDNPRDLAFLKHDKPLNASRTYSHMKHVPSYLMPRIAPVDAAGNLLEQNEAGGDATTSTSTSGTGKTGYVPFRKNGKPRDAKGKGKHRGGAKKGGSKRGDPLKTFKRK